MRTTTLILILIVTVGSRAGRGTKRARMVTVTERLPITMTPVRGVLIIADGQRTGVVTRVNGAYRIRIRPEVKSLGYTAQI